ncbi:ubiquitin carboxyl-terminal hydrolase 18-like [Canna indica]|uniref:Ubiquitin carboxyl-terminal hydrolase 18-like n=1 Tax=Canna indica TaxID=4628 RepID=A0AAQ3KR31_9LILI|nr:ubiquitin carboxyl-terminal hydrolase 18-like [Canna indica]
MLLYSRISARKEPFVKHVEEPQKKKQLVVTDPKLASPDSVSCVGSDTDTQSSHGEFSLLTNTINKRKLSDDVDPAEDKERDVMVLNVPLAEKPLPIHKSLGDLEFCNPSSSSAIEGLEDVNPGLLSSMPSSSLENKQLDYPLEHFATEVDDDKCQRPCANFNAGSHTAKDSESTIKASTAPSNVNTVLDPYLTTCRTAKSIVSEPSKYSYGEAVHLMETYGALDSAAEVNNLDKALSDSGGNKATPSSCKNKSNSIFEAVSSHSLLDSPGENKSLVSEEEKQICGHSIARVKKENGNSNGCYQTGLTELKSANKSTDGIPGDMSFMSRGFLQKSYAKSSETKKTKGVKKPASPCKASCNGSAKCTSENMDFRSVIASCNGSSLTKRNDDHDPESVFASENGNGNCNDGPPTPLTLERKSSLAPAKSCTQHARMMMTGLRIICCKF